jgi:predicted RNA-binding Zn ribbon-like protein
MATRGSDSVRDDEQVVVAFVNTHGYGQHPDRLADGSELLGWLEEVAWLGAPRSDAQVTDADAAEARELRDALVVALLEHARDPDTGEAHVEAAEAILRRAGERYPLVAAIDSGGARLGSRQPELAGVFGQVLASIATLSLGGRWPRVKACRNAPCHRAFIDTTRNTSAAYCRPECASRASMRAYRARRRAAAARSAESE